MAKASPTPKGKLRVVEQPATAIIADYRIAYMSRQASLIGRKEVLTGKAKFGIFGDGKEVAQIAMAKAFRPGDWRSGYYRDQTFMMALGACTVQQFFAQLYADTDLEHEPMTGGRQMNAHFSTRYVDADGSWMNQKRLHNTSADMSPTAGQMSRLVGLGFASKLYRGNGELADLDQFSVKGDEVAFGTIGNASTAEGIFWESLNACGVLQIPVAISVWDDGYGISVPNRYQMTKESISEITKGFQDEHGKGAGGLPGIDIHKIPGWDYAALCEAYAKGIDKVRREHTPALFHIYDLTQPQGHSTSGSHERYKKPERMAFEEREDCLRRMRDWMVSTGAASSEELSTIETECLADVERQRQAAWRDFMGPIEADRDRLIGIYEALLAEGPGDPKAVEAQIGALKKAPALMRRTVMSSARRTLLAQRGQDGAARKQLVQFVDAYGKDNRDRFSKWLLSETERSPLAVKEVKAVYDANPEQVPGSDVIAMHFDSLMERDPRVFIIGEDVGQLGGVNQEFKGLQEKYGEIRISDTGIREATILGQGIGAAMRGLRPVVDIQYLDYLLYCFQGMSDDLATLHYRSAGGQIAPVLIRTKGHRLEGIWHTGSPMGTIIHGVRGIHVCVPRNMVQAVGLYNTLFQGDDPALVIEVLNGYRLREAVPSNLSEFTIPLGVPEVVLPGKDVTVVTYGACVRIAEEAAKLLADIGVTIEIVDVRTLLPFDRFHVIGASVEKTNAVIFFDEDVPGGAAAYMMQQVLEGQGAYECLDAKPRTLTAEPHRSAYASDGDYWCKPSTEDLVEAVYDMMRERDPSRFPARR
jgi:pyruvate/2-oxoglutarate/acetoin dehydrogenase E1 component/TPP-dependent pyruvate/acetoin dehydrogenase alpha subunit